MVEYSDINDIMSVITVILYFIFREMNKEVNVLIIILLWYHLIRGIITFVMDIAMWEDYFSINAIIDLCVGVLVFLRDFSIYHYISYFFMIILLIKSIYNIFSPFDGLFGEE